MTQVIDLTVAALAQRLRTADLRAQDVTQAYLDRIRAHDGALHAFHTVAAEQALARAAALDKARESGAVTGPLHGVPVALKDNM